MIAENRKLDYAGRMNNSVVQYCIGPMPPSWRSQRQGKGGEKSIRKNPA
jgi:hypothetical protein